MNQPRDYYKYIFNCKDETFTVKHYVVYEDVPWKGRLPYVLEGDEDKKFNYIYDRMTYAVYISGRNYMLVIEENDISKALDMFEEFFKGRVKHYETSLEGARKRFDSFLVTKENVKWRA